MVHKILKRDGTTVNFERDKISNAIFKAAQSVGGTDREEAEKLTGFGESAGKDRELLVSLNKLGPKICIITDGGNGSLAYDSVNGKFVKAGVLPVDAYERTGAGDAFGSGSLSALIHGKTLDEALLWGTVNSASVIGYTGPQKGLLKETEIDEWIIRYKSSGVTISPL